MFIRHLFSILFHFVLMLLSFGGGKKLKIVSAGVNCYIQIIFLKFLRLFSESFTLNGVMFL